MSIWQTVEKNCEQLNCIYECVYVKDREYWRDRGRETEIDASTDREKQTYEGSSISLYPNYEGI